MKLPCLIFFHTQVFNHKFLNTKNSAILTDSHIHYMPLWRYFLTWLHKTLEASMGLHI